jgi:predicted transcriptional regulator
MKEYKERLKDLSLIEYRTKATLKLFILSITTKTCYTY